VTFPNLATVILVVIAVCLVILVTR